MGFPVRKSVISKVHPPLHLVLLQMRPSMSLGDMTVTVPQAMKQATE